MTTTKTTTDDENHFNGERILAMDAHGMVTRTTNTTLVYKRDSLGLGWVLIFTVAE